MTDKLSLDILSNDTYTITTGVPQAPVGGGGIMQRARHTRDDGHTEERRKAEEQARKDALEMSTAGWEVFGNIADKWKLTPQEQMKLLGISPATYFRWKKRTPAVLPQDTLERLSHILGIYDTLHDLLEESDADQALRDPIRMDLFNNEPPMNRMLAGKVSDLYVVRQFLDSQLGGWG
jgi:hypothetical protein